jgi:hypothetical protein
LDVSYFKTIYNHYEKDHADYNDVKANFGNLLDGVKEGVTTIAQGIAANDVKNGVDPTTNPKQVVISDLGTKMGALSGANTAGHDRLCRTNDVIGVGVVVDF